METIAESLGIKEKEWEDFITEVASAYRDTKRLDEFYERLEDKPQLLLATALAHHLSSPLFVLIDREHVPSRLAISLLAFYLEKALHGKTPEYKTEMAREFAKIPKPLLIALLWHVCHTSIDLAERLAGFSGR